MAHPVSKEIGCESYLKGESNVIPKPKVIFHMFHIRALIKFVLIIFLLLGIY